MTSVNNRIYDCLAQLTDALNAGDSVKAKTLASFAMQLSDGLDPYMEQYSSQPSELVKQLSSQSQTTDWKQLYNDGVLKYKLFKVMCAGDYESVVLQMFARLAKVQNVLEIGMFVGSTTLALAQVDGVKNVTTLEIEPHLETIARPFWQAAHVDDKIRVLIGDGIESLRRLTEEQRKFDMVFIDADKDGYIPYYDFIMDHDLLSQDGAIYADNTLLKGMIWSERRTDLIRSDAFSPDPASICKFNEHVRADDRVDVIVLPIRDGLSIIKKKANRSN